MSKRALAVGLASTLILIASVAESRAQERRVVDPERPVTVEPLAQVAVDAVAPSEQLHPPSRLRPSSVSLTSLYVSTAVLQGLDVHSTLTSIRRGADEANPMVKGLVEHPAAFVAVKAAFSAGTILAARSIARKNKIVAIAALVAIDSLYVITVNHNYQVARRMR